MRKRSLIAAALLALPLGGCYPVTETYFSPNAPGGQQVLACAEGEGYKLHFHSANVPWARLTVYPLLLPDGGMRLRIDLHDDLYILRRDSERVRDWEPDLRQGWAAQAKYEAAQSVRAKSVQYSGPIIVTWPPDNRFEMPATEGFSKAFVVPGFTGDSAVVTLPGLSIDGKSETFAPITIQRRTGVTVASVNGC